MKKLIELIKRIKFLLKDTKIDPDFYRLLPYISLVTLFIVVVVSLTFSV